MLYFHGETFNAYVYKAPNNKTWVLNIDILFDEPIHFLVNNIITAKYILKSYFKDYSVLNGELNFTNYI